MDQDLILQASQALSEQSQQVAASASDLQGLIEKSIELAQGAAPSAPSSLMVGLTVFVLGVFIGYHVVWRVTPALHSPLMGVTNAISSVIIVGALIGTGLPDFGPPKFISFLAVFAAAVNIFGGFAITHRMLEMFNAKAKQKN